MNSPDVSFGFADWIDENHIYFEHTCPNPPFADPARNRQQVVLPLNATTGWQVASRDPLTVTPSILSSCCGIHGFITDGKWLSV